MEIQQILDLMTPDYRAERARLSEESRRLAQIRAAKRYLSSEGILDAVLDQNDRLRVLGTTATSNETLIVQQ